MVTRLHGGAAAVLLGLASSFAFLSAPASAQYGAIVVQGTPAPNVRIERVAYGDLNLATRAGAQALQMRIGHAVEDVCLYDQHRWYGLSEPAYTQCAASAWRRARPQMEGAIYRARRYAAYYRY